MFTLNDFPLNYKLDALTPFLSERALDFHYNKHLNTYVNTLSSLIAGTKYEKLSLNEIIQESYKEASDKKIFNNAAQTFNHDFFFKCLKLNDSSAIPTEIIKTYQTKENFFKSFKESALSLFGSGWTWLVRNANGDLEIINTANAETPFVQNKKPILCLDIWEHSYYLDYQNKRADYIDAFLNNLINWNFVSENLQK